MEDIMIGIIYIDDLWGCPYLDKYTDILQEQNENYEVIFWNRKDKKEQYPLHHLCYAKASSYSKHPIFKIRDFLQFSKWVKGVINKRKYDKLIILSTLSGIFIAKTLLKNYRGKYIFDIRDYSYESIRPFYKLEESLIKNSYFTCISSEGFKKFLPQNHSYVMVHNFNYNDIEFRRKFKRKEKKSSINIVFNGAMRYFEHQSQIISKIKNDNRFNMIYHGTGPELEMFKNHCKENNINNVKFTGTYKNPDKYKLLEDADILNNSYGTKKTMEIKYAVSNKYYDGLVFSIPQLVEVGTFKQTKVEDADVGVGFDVHDEGFADKLYNYYFEIDEEKFNDSCDEELKQILEEDKEYLKRIRAFIAK